MPLSVTRGRPGQAPVGRARPGVEDQLPVAAEQHHHVRAGVRPDAGQREQPLGDLLVGQRGVGRAPRGRAGPRRRRRRSCAGRRRGSRPWPRRRRSPRPPAAIAAASGTSAAPARRGRRAELADQRADHPHRRRPRAVGRADRLDEVLEHRRAAQHPPGAGGHPGEVRVLGRAGVEGAEVVVEAQHVADHGGQLADGAPRRRLDPRRRGTAVRDAHDPRAPAGAGSTVSSAEPSARDRVRRQVGDAVREQRAREVDRLAAARRAARACASRHEDSHTQPVALDQRPDGVHVHRHLVARLDRAEGFEVGRRRARSGSARGRRSTGRSRRAR